MEPIGSARLTTIKRFLNSLEQALSVPEQKVLEWLVALPLACAKVAQISGQDAALAELLGKPN
jgi:hypothetical protein